jgi:tryptophanyl-tRNA synthetase
LCSSTAALLRRAKTDGEQRIRYDRQRRPEAASLLRLAALWAGQDPHQIAENVGYRRAGALKAVVTDMVNEHLQRFVNAGPNSPTSSPTCATS